MKHFILMGCIEYGEGTALISCGEDKQRAEELAAELNALVRNRNEPHVGSTDPFVSWKHKHGFEMEETVLLDKYEVHEVILI